MAQLEGRLEYVRGLLEAQELTEDERRDRALVALVDQVSELSAGFALLTGEVAALRSQLAQARGSAAEPVAQPPATETVFCPGCAGRIPLPSRRPARFEVDCPQCGATLEVE
jgi:hypothetical protein